MERDQASKFVNDLLRLMISRNGSDLFLTADFPPAIKVDGKVTKVSPQPLTGQHTMALARCGDERQAGRRVRENQGVQLRDLAAGHRALPLQRVRADGPHRPGVPRDSADAADGRPARPAQGAEGHHDDQARPGHHGGRHRLGQEHVAGGDGRLAQRALARPHHHHRGPGGVRAPAQELHHHAARSRHRHRRLGARAEEHAAPGARRHPDGRDPRPRDDGARGGLRRNRPPVHGHACTPTAPTRRSTASSTSSPKSGAPSC